ncbi:large ribosomal subunit protein uL18m isoform X2 [Microcaecilia unicolor]|uniref:Large ribosomal subunit protein uL18m n=1 Tax=Microcaecilia unicolor TaxID=1415580 RepID=A0A6P7X6I2_9AMPH|nr:39S ribosomal protein L18, mitochondrial isoform X2 [Microcaecilia unicolor]
MAGSMRLTYTVRLLETRANVQLYPESKVDTRENEVVSPHFMNRNPRNLERMALARKDRGWATVWPSRQFWHRLRFERSQNHVTAFVEHCDGHVVVSASTQEWAVKRHLYSTRDAAASENVGRVLAQRCLEAGISYMVFKVIPWEFNHEGVQRFRNAMMEGGVVLTEPRRIYQ